MWSTGAILVCDFMGNNGSPCERVAHPGADLELESCHPRNGQTSKLEGKQPMKYAHRHCVAATV